MHIVRIEYPISFLGIPYFSDVDVIPLQHITTLGGNVTFTCVLPPVAGITGINWLVNGCSLVDLNLTNVQDVFVMRNGIGSGVLRFRNVPVEYSETRVTCVATTMANGNIRASPSNRNGSLLLVQGL